MIWNNQRLLHLEVLLEFSTHPHVYLTPAYPIAHV